jgi:UDP-N-acetylmuramate--alanine ligase
MPRTVETVPAPLRTDSPNPSRFTGQRIHFVGIGGSGMSGLARMLVDRGATVTGSEPTPNQTTFELTARGVKITRDQVGELLTKDVSLVCRTAAVNDANREIVAAKALGLPIVKYAELLGMVMRERFGIAVAGTHGKSTTSAMISYALLACGADPSFVIGGTVRQLAGGSRSGAGPFFVAEACEYTRSFHSLAPRVAIVTNIEEDHLDCYKDIHDIVQSFHDFAKLVPHDGLIIASGTDANVRRALTGVDCTIETCAIELGHAWSTVITDDRGGRYEGVVYRHGLPVAQLKLSVAGRHNLINATMALAACVTCGIDPQKAADALGQFTGVDRRMTEMGTINGATIVDDYGHHPTEIRATLRALKERYQPRKLFCIFQPHQASRTRLLMQDFASSFALADETIVPEIYFVRDSDLDRRTVSSQDLVNRINANGQKATFLPDFAAIADHVRASAGQGDLIVTMGAGNVWEIGRELAS